MSDDRIKAWLDERQRVHAAAEPSWWTTRDLQPATVFAGDGSADDIAVLTTFEHSDATAIVDSHNHLPAALAAIEAVLVRHQRSQHPRPVGFPRADREEYYCVSDRETYPCPTRRDLEAVIGDE